MKNVAMRLIVSAGMCLFAAQACSAQSAWFGTWKLDRSQSHLVGPSITIARFPHGYHFDFGAVSFNVGDDGKEYPTIPTRTTILKPIGKREWYRVHKVNGKEVDHGTLTVTADGKKLLIHTVATSPDGKTHTSDEVDLRIGKGSGLAGTWRSTDKGVNVSPIFTLSDAGKGAGGEKIRRDFPDEGQSYVAVPNGTPVSYTGPRAAPTVTVSLRAVSAREMRWAEFVNGRPYDKGIDLLSADGRTMRETSWPVARPQDRQEAVYDKQYDKQ